jgi:prepilin-type N-terminal cleavage/methylation domain-containing protein
MESSGRGIGIRHRLSGFTLVELMIVVAIIGILASVAIPNYSRFVLRAKRSEAFVCLDGIRTSEYVYNAAFDTYVTAESNPGLPLEKRPKPWDMAIPGWSALHWSPTGAVRCTYLVNTYDDAAWFRAEAYCDVDGNSEPAVIWLASWRSGESEAFQDLFPNRF